MKKWVTKKYQADFGKIAERYHISNVLAELLVKRGLFDWESMNRFLFPEMKHLRNPYEMKDFTATVEKLEEAIASGKRILVVGDYDVDGVTSTYILVRGLRILGGKIGFRIPHRIRDGYGIRDYMAKEAKEQGYDLILTCDNGISAQEAVKKAKELGLSVILTDHHEVPKKEGKDDLPPADAIIDPKRQDCSYPFRELCGAGIAYKLMQELLERSRKTEALEELLPFAALATVCDVVPLFDENRILVKNGLLCFQKLKNLGLHTLLEMQGLNREVQASDLGFRLGPCVNAAGRLADAQKGLELFLEEDVERAKERAEELLMLNEKRKSYTVQATEQAIQMIESEGVGTKPVYVLLLEHCHESVAGIVAGRLREKYFHPVLVFTRGERGLKGSGRSIPGYHMQQEISKCEEYLTEFGGHAMAAGLSLPEENYEMFSEKLNQNCTLTEEDFIEKISFDKELPLKEVTEKLVRELQLLEPFGEGNPEVSFAAREVRISSMRLCGQENQIARLRLAEGTVTYQAVDFQCERHLEEAVRNRYGEETWERMKQGVISEVLVDILYQPQINERYGGVDFQIVDCR